jgi:hypothetical protein
MKITNRRILLTLFILSVTKLGFSSVPAGETKFQETMNSISTFLKTPIVAESQPLQSSLSPELQAKWKRSPSFKTAEEIINAFDYDIKRSNNCILLVKRYSSPQDMPCVNFDECLNSLQNLSQFVSQNNHKLSLSSFTNGELHSPRTDLITKTFSQQHMAFLSNGGVLTESDLLPQEKETLNKVCVDFWLSEAENGTTRKIEEYNAVKNKQIFFSFANHSNASVFGYDVGKNKHYPLSDPDRVFGENFASPFAWGDASTLPDITAPTAEDERHLQERRKQNKFTLDDWFTGLGAVPFRLNMEKGINKKEISVFGSQKENATKILRSISEIYGLDLKYKNAEKTYYLTYPALPSTRSFMDITTVAQKIYPVPILHMIQRQNNRKYMVENSDSTFLSSIRRLKFILSQRMKEKKMTRIAFFEDNDEENLYFSIALITIPFSQNYQNKDSIIMLTNSPMKDYVSYSIKGGVYVADKNKPNDLYFRLGVVGIGSVGQKINGFYYSHSRYYGVKPQ